LRLVAHRAPPGVIAVLLPSTRIAPHRLDVSVCHGADPHRGPRGRDGEAPDPPERGEIANRLTVHADVAERPDVADALYPRARVRHVPELRGIRRLAGIERDPAQPRPAAGLWNGWRQGQSH